MADICYGCGAALLKDHHRTYECDTTRGCGRSESCYENEIKALRAALRMMLDMSKSYDADDFYGCMFHIREKTWKEASVPAWALLDKGQEKQPADDEYWNKLMATNRARLDPAERKGGG